MQRLVEEYTELRSRADTHAAGLRTLVLVLDLERALPYLSLDAWEVVLLHGLIGLDQETTANRLQISQQAVSKRYRGALDWLHFTMNGGFDH